MEINEESFAGFYPEIGSIWKFNVNGLLNVKVLMILNANPIYGLKDNVKLNDVDVLFEVINADFPYKDKVSSMSLRFWEMQMTLIQDAEAENTQDKG